MFLATLAVFFATPPASPFDALNKSIEFHGFQLSPDGKRLAWVESVSGFDGHLSEKRVIRVLDLTKAKAEPVRVTAGKGKPQNEGKLVWSPDGKKLAFLSDAHSEGQLQLYVAVPNN